MGTCSFSHPILLSFTCGKIMEIYFEEHATHLFSLAAVEVGCKVMASL